MNYLIFSDLDGTFLDHDTYSWSEAQQALNKSQEVNCPIVFCSSKTVSEINDIRNATELFYPIIAENGAVVIENGTWNNQQKDQQFTYLADNCDSFQQDLIKLKQISNDNLRYLIDFDLQEIIDFTGLTEDSAKKCQTRTCSMPFVWTGTAPEMKLWEEDVNKYKYKILKGGRFYHLMPNVDKGQAVKYLTDKFKKQEVDFQTVALGDSPNDLDMLKVVDIPIIIKTPNGHMIELENAISTKKVGPAGWNEAILEILQ